MYKVELTEKEIRGIGVNRYFKNARKRVLITFIVGLVAVMIGAYFWGYAIGKVWMILACAVWVASTLYQNKQAGRAGLKFLEEIKDAKDNNKDI